MLHRHSGWPRCPQHTRGHADVFKLPPIVREFTPPPSLFLCGGSWLFLEIFVRTFLGLITKFNLLENPSFFTCNFFLSCIYFYLKLGLCILLHFVGYNSLCFFIHSTVYYISLRYNLRHVLKVCSTH